MIHLVRHGDAGRATPALGDDRLRPLTPHGHDQALDLVTAFEHAPIDRVLSSPAVRCVDTVAPLAEARGLGVEVEPLLFEGSRAAQSIDLVERLIAEGCDAVLASHGDVIPDLLRLLAMRGVDLSGPSGCQKAGRWSIDVGPAWTGFAVYHGPPGS